MRSCLPIGALLILTLAGCERPGQPGAKVEIQAALPDPGGAIPGPAAFPQEPDKAPAKPIAAPRLFRATGLDEAGRRFEGYLAVETAQEGYLRRGYFEWAPTRAAAAITSRDPTTPPPAASAGSPTASKTASRPR